MERMAFENWTKKKDGCSQTLHPQSYTIKMSSNKLWQVDPRMQRLRLPRVKRDGHWNSPQKKKKGIGMLFLRPHKKSGRALDFSSDDLRSDDEVILKAVKKIATALQFAKGGKHLNHTFLQAAGLHDNYKYDHNKKQCILSTWFSLGEESKPTATIFSLLMKKNPFFSKYNQYLPNVFTKTYCNLKNFRNIKRPCKDTDACCEKSGKFKTGHPRKDSCWR